MNDLNKILVEIEENKHIVEIFGRGVFFVPMEVTKDIIRKHMNDGWIPVEERLPEEKEWKAYNKQFNCIYLKRLELAYKTDTVEYIHGYYDGEKWIDKRYNIIKNVVAWRIHEPYRPERKE